MLNFATVPYNTGILRHNKTLLKVRLIFYSSAFVQLVSVSYLLLTIDFSKYDDPDIQIYQKIRLKLITTWFNLFNVIYYPICLYCDWQELKGEHEQRHVELLNRVRYLCFTSIIMPVTAFGDILFWRMWNTRRELIAPLIIHTVVPFWSQHSMHTLSLIIVITDLILVRPKRPKNNTPNIIVMSIFLLAYMYVCMDSCINGIYVYPALKLFTGFKLVLLIVYVFVEILFYYTSQWFIVDMLWGRDG